MMSDASAITKSPVPKTRQRHCFVPLCKTGYDRKKGASGLSLFGPPKNPELFAKWKRLIPRKDKELHQSCSVCELHFAEEHIVRNFKHIVNGDVVLIPRGKPLLTEDAIPTIFPNLPKYFSIKLPKKRKERNICNTPIPESKRKCTNDKLCLVSNTSTVKLSDFVQNTEENCWFSEEQMDDVKLPSKFWAKHCFPYQPNTVAFVMCVLNMNNSLNPLFVQKVVLVTKVNDIIGSKAYVRGVEVEQRSSVESKEMMESILLGVDNLKSCTGAGTIEEYELAEIKAAKFNVSEKVVFSTKCFGHSGDKQGACLSCRHLRKLFANKRALLRKKNKVT